MNAKIRVRMWGMIDGWWRNCTVSYVSIWKLRSKRLRQEHFILAKWKCGARTVLITLYIALF